MVPGIEMIKAHNELFCETKKVKNFLFVLCVLRKTTQCPNFCRGLPRVGVMLNRASGLIVESLEEVAASYGKSVATHPVKVRLGVLD